jgi:hypothetical protein
VTDNVRCTHNTGSSSTPLRSPTDPEPARDSRGGSAPLDLRLPVEICQPLDSVVSAVIQMPHFAHPHTASVR